MGAVIGNIIARFRAWRNNRRALKAHEEWEKVMEQPRQEKDDETAIERDTWVERALNARQDLAVFRGRLEWALGDFEHHGNADLLVERLHRILDEGE